MPLTPPVHPCKKNLCILKSQIFGFDILTNMAKRQFGVAKRQFGVAKCYFGNPKIPVLCVEYGDLGGSTS